MIAKYLRSHAEPEAAAVSLRDAGGLRQALAVPAYAEPVEHFALLDSLPTGSGTLCVLLVNERTDSPPAALERNRAFVDMLRARHGAGRAVGAGATEHRTPFGGLLLMHRTADTQSLPADQGVGLARKIVCDVVLSLASRGQVDAEIIHCTDADARLPNDYFSRVRSRGGAPFAAVFPFEHVGGGDGLHRAGQQYERSLRYYVIGLQRAGSPYAMHTIGSTIAVSTRAYAAVRGFPRRHGAEDFYLLNKLAKVGPVERLDGAPIALRDRTSDRIPFGTGPAVRRILSGEPKRLYHPQTFALLGDFLRGLAEIARAQTPAAGATALARSLCPALAPDTGATLVTASGIERAVAAAFERGPAVSARLRHLHTYFDGFRTLKWVHALRAAGFEEATAKDAVAELLEGGASSLPGDLARLKRVEAAECRGDVGIETGARQEPKSTIA